MSMDHHPIGSIDVSRSVLDLLRASDLPVADLDRTTPVRMYGVLIDGSVAGLAGCVGLEVHGDAGLLRSLAVAPEHRSQGMGLALVRHAERQAIALGITTMWLLTTSATPFFSRQGYTPVARAEVRKAIRDTAQFAALCPASATVMKKALSI
jgi:amino-acid N-acetyltransferase